MTTTTPGLMVYQDFNDHPKTIRLRHLLDTRAPAHLVLLWLWTFNNRHDDGDLTGLSNNEIATVAHWPNNTSGEFVRALQQSKFLDGEPNAYKIHNWKRRRSFEGETMRRMKISNTKRRVPVRMLYSLDSSCGNYFKIFWKIYPKKVGQKQAWVEWQRVVANDSTKAEFVIGRVKAHLQSRKWIEGFIHDPERYIKHERFNDILESAQPSPRATIGKAKTDHGSCEGCGHQRSLICGKCEQCTMREATG